MYMQIALGRMADEGGGTSDAKVAQHRTPAPASPDVTNARTASVVETASPEQKASSTPPKRAAAKDASSSTKRPSNITNTHLHSQKLAKHCLAKLRVIDATSTKQLKYIYRNRSGTRELGAKQQFMIGDHKLAIKFHPFTKKRRQYRKTHRPRVQLTADHCERLGLPIIDGSEAAVNVIRFPNGSKCYAIFARKNSECPLLRNLHSSVYEGKHPNGSEVDAIVASQDRNNNWIIDDAAGGRFLRSGYGNLGRNSKDKDDPCQPALTKNMTKIDHCTIATHIGHVFFASTAVLRAYCPREHKSNQLIKKTNHRIAWPPIDCQDKDLNWMSTQFALRTWGASMGTLGNLTLDEAITALHVDFGDIHHYMPNMYWSGGGKRGRGGSVAGTDIAIFEHEHGGTGVRIKTCIEDTVIIVLTRSSTQLHGNVLEEEDKSKHDKTAWTTRVIPYVQKGVYGWMEKNPTKQAFTAIP